MIYNLPSVKCYVNDVVRIFVYRATGDNIRHIHLVTIKSVLKAYLLNFVFMPLSMCLSICYCCGLSKFAQSTYINNGGFYLSLNPQRSYSMDSIRIFWLFNVW